MALRFLEGFESRQNATYFSRVYATVAGAITSFVEGRKVGSAARAINHTLTTYPLVSPDSNTWILGFGYFMENTAATSITIMDSTSTAQLTLLFAAGTTFNTFTIAIKRGSTTLATSGELQMNRWHFFELKATIRTSTNGSYTLKDDGVTILTASGVNTANTGVDGASVFQFNWGGGISRFDDIYVCDATGGIHDDFLGSKAILGILPNGDGASSQWLPSTGSNHSQLVDDTPSTPNDLDYVSSNTTTDLDLYDFGNTTDLAADGTLDAVIVFLTAAMLSAGGRGLKIRFRTSGGSTDDSSQFNVTNKGSFRTFIIPFDQDPVAASAWTKTALDGGQFGPLNFVEL